MVISFFGQNHPCPFLFHENKTYPVFSRCAAPLLLSQCLPSSHVTSKKIAAILAIAGDRLDFFFHIKPSPSPSPPSSQPPLPLSRSSTARPTPSPLASLSPPGSPSSPSGPPGPSSSPLPSTTPSPSSLPAVPFASSSTSPPPRTMTSLPSSMRPAPPSPPPPPPLAHLLSPPLYPLVMSSSSQSIPLLSITARFSEPRVLYQEMEWGQDGMVPNGVMMVSMLHACAELKDLVLGFDDPHKGILLFPIPTLTTALVATSLFG